MSGSVQDRNVRFWVGGGHDRQRRDGSLDGDGGRGAARRGPRLDDRREGRPAQSAAGLPRDLRAHAAAVDGGLRLSGRHAHAARARGGDGRRSQERPRGLGHRPGRARGLRRAPPAAAKSRDHVLLSVLAERRLVQVCPPTSVRCSPTWPSSPSSRSARSTCTTSCPRASARPSWLRSTPCSPRPRSPAGVRAPRSTSARGSRRRAAASPP
jgi:hypothetical protein